MKELKLHVHMLISGLSRVERNFLVIRKRVFEEHEQGEIDLFDVKVSPAFAFFLW